MMNQQAMHVVTTYDEAIGALLEVAADLGGLLTYSIARRLCMSELANALHLASTHPGPYVHGRMNLPTEIGMKWRASHTGDAVGIQTPPRRLGELSLGTTMSVLRLFIVDMERPGTGSRVTWCPANISYDLPDEFEAVPEARQAVYGLLALSLLHGQYVSEPPKPSSSSYVDGWSTATPIEMICETAGMNAMFGLCVDRPEMSLTGASDPGLYSLSQHNFYVSQSNAFAEDLRRLDLAMELGELYDGSLNRALTLVPN